MFFNHKTKKFSGKIRDITPEEDAYGRKLVEQGVMESTEHPSDEEITMEKQNLAIYLEIDDMGTDQDGNSVPAGMKVDFGEAKNVPPYEELVKNINLAALVNIMPFPRTLEPELKAKLKAGKIRIITPEQYEELYGDDDTPEEDETN